MVRLPFHFLKRRQFIQVTRTFWKINLKIVVFFCEIGRLAKTKVSEEHDQFLQNKKSYPLTRAQLQRDVLELLLQNFRMTGIIQIKMPPAHWPAGLVINDIVNGVVGLGFDSRTG